MPVRNKTYALVTQAAALSSRPIPSNPARRFLMIQNTGAQPGQVRFGDPNQGVGADFLWIAGFMFKWDQPDAVPTEAINLASTAQTTWVVMEGTWTDAPGRAS